VLKKKMEIQQQEETKQRKSWGQQSFGHEMKWASKMGGLYNIHETA
jgi:hypothetical protein